jgi:hypothetical protein
MKKVFGVLGVLLGLYLMARAISWPFTVDASDPSTYASDWGGPTLLGAAAVHCGPGLLAAALIIAAIVRGRIRSRRRSEDARLREGSR